MRYAIPAAAIVAALVFRFGFGFLTTTAIFLAVLIFLVIMHELGHFTVAKLSGIKVMEFGLGYPPRIWGFKRGGTEYTINLLPLGGFVRMLGEEDPTEASSFAAQSAWKRLAVLVAGPGMNAVLPIFLLIIAFMVPRTVSMTDVTIVQVVPGAPAAQGGVQVGDILREVDGNEVINSSTVEATIQARLGADMSVVVQRQGHLVDLTIPEVRVNPPAGQGATGIVLSDGRVSVTSVTPGSPAGQIGLQAGDELLDVNGARVLNVGDAKAVVDATLASDPSSAVPIDVLRGGKFVSLSFAPSLGSLTGLTESVRPDVRESDSFTAAVPKGLKQLKDILATFRNQIGKLISGGGGFEVAGPVGIAQMTGEVAKAGLGPLVTLMALLSINLAIVNVLPIPALDGGRMVFVLLELARGGRKIAPEKEQLVHLIGFAILMGVILLVTANDIQRLFSGGLSLSV